MHMLMLAQTTHDLPHASPPHDKEDSSSKDGAENARRDDAVDQPNALSQAEAEKFLLAQAKMPISKLHHAQEYEAAAFNLDSDARMALELGSGVHATTDLRLIARRQRLAYYIHPFALRF